MYWHTIMHGSTVIIYLPVVCVHVYGYMPSKHNVCAYLQRRNEIWAKVVPASVWSLLFPTWRESRRYATDLFGKGSSEINILVALCASSSPSASDQWHGAKCYEEQNSWAKGTAEQRCPQGEVCLFIWREGTGIHFCKFAAAIGCFHDIINVIAIAGPCRREHSKVISLSSRASRQRKWKRNFKSRYWLMYMYIYDVLCMHVHVCVIGVCIHITL